MAEVDLGVANDEETVPVRLLHADGNLYRELRLKPEFATRIINFLGGQYVWNVEKAGWIWTAEHPESALSGVLDD